MNLIPEVTKECAREDCKIIGGGWTSTLMSWMPTYDKHGKQTDVGDPNTQTTSFKCLTCNASWRVNICMGKRTITPRDPPNVLVGKEIAE